VRDRKNSFRSFIYSQSSTIPANLVKIGPVDVEIIGLTEIIKYIYIYIYIYIRQNIWPTFGFLEAGGLKMPVRPTCNFNGVRGKMAEG